MKFLAFPILAIILLGASRNEIPIKELTVRHETQCDYSYDRQEKIAVDFCLLAADEWAQVAAKYNKKPEGLFAEIMEALTRTQTSMAMKHEGNVNALSQMDLAFTIVKGVCREDEAEFAIQACNAVGRAAVKNFPEVYTFTKPQEKIK